MSSVGLIKMTPSRTLNLLVRLLTRFNRICLVRIYGGQSGSDEWPVRNHLPTQFFILTSRHHLSLFLAPYSGSGSAEGLRGRKKNYLSLFIPSGNSEVSPACGSRPTLPAPLKPDRGLELTHYRYENAPPIM